MLKTRIEELRKDKRLTQKELGSEVGLSGNTISQYENGKREPKMETLIKIADFFKVSTPYLLYMTDDKSIYSSWSSSKFWN